MDQRGRKNRPYHGRGGERWRAHGGTRRLATLPPPLGEIVATIQLEDIDDSATQGDNRAQITNSQYLTSYNWITGADHHIVVPGQKTHLTEGLS